MRNQTLEVIYPFLYREYLYSQEMWSPSLFVKKPQKVQEISW